MPVLRDHYNFITSSHSNIDDDGDGDDVSGEFSCVILEAAWARSPLRSDLIEKPLDVTLRHDVFRHHFPVAHPNDSMDSSMLAQDSQNRCPGAIHGCRGEEKPRRLVKISRSRVGTRRASFPALSTPRKILRKRPRCFEDPRASFSSDDSFSPPDGCTRMDQQVQRARAPANACTSSTTTTHDKFV